MAPVEGDRFDVDLMAGLGMEGALFLAAGLGLLAALVGVPFRAGPLAVWGALGTLATMATLPLPAWSQGRAYRPSATGTVGLLLLPVAGLLAGASRLGRGAAATAWMHVSWVLLFLAALLLLLHLRRAAGREGLPVPTQRFAPTWTERANGPMDQAARWNVLVAQAYLALGALFGLRVGWDGSAADATGTLLWYGWLGSLALATVFYFLPRLFGARIKEGAGVALATGLWHAGVLLFLLFGVRAFLLATVAGGAAAFVLASRVAQAAGRRTLRVVGSRRQGLVAPHRQMVLVGIAFGLLAALTVPWWDGLHGGAAHILWAWLLFLLVPLTVHVRAEGRPGGTLVAVLAAGVLGSFLELWPGVGAEAGQALFTAALVGLGVLLLRRPPPSSQVPYREREPGRTGLRRS